MLCYDPPSAQLLLLLQVGDEEEFTAVPESSERAQQARELGPLYSTLFAVADSIDDDIL